MNEINESVSTLKRNNAQEIEKLKTDQQQNTRDVSFLNINQYFNFKEYKLN